MKKYFFLLCFFSINSFANNLEITLVTEHLPPYQIVHDDSSITGLAVDIVLEVLKHANINYSLHSYPWVRTYNLALKKANHCAFSMARIKKREKLFSWIGPLTESANSIVWSLKSNKNSQKVKKLDDLKEFTTAVIEQDLNHIGMLSIGLVENENLYVLSHTKSLISLLATRPEIDFIVADDIAVYHRAKDAGISMDLLKRVIEVKDLPINLYLACNLNTDEQIIKKLTKSLAMIHQDGTYQKIINKWKNNLILP